MNQTYTLLSLCEAYQKIEIPIIQRNYVQGNDKTIRRHFVKYLVKALTQQSSVELDFVYGAERQDTRLTDNCAPNNCAPQVGKVLIPLDGQQRLTTLWLLHGYLLALEQVSNNPEQLSLEERETQCQLLARFVYETRQSAKDFCGYWLQEVTQRACQELVDKPSEYLRNCAWFDPEWEKEGTVTAMLGMLDEVASKRAELQAVPYGRLSKCIRFYYLPIEKFGLSNELYIRMNARGEQLTSFEHFKSSFYKVIQEHQSLSAIKEKMEYDWVDALWQYRPKDTHVTDHPFMKCLSFVTEVLHIKAYKGEEDYKTPQPVMSKADPYTELSLIESVYQEQAHVTYLEQTLDCVENLKGIQYDNLLKDSDTKKTLSFQEILARMLTIGTNDNVKRILLYTAIAYVQHHNTIDGIVPLLRVVRNLSTNANKEKNLTKIYLSLDELVKVPNIYDYLAHLQGGISGFSDTQLEEEKAKAQLRLARPEVNVLLDEIEDFFSGKIFNLLCEVAETATLNEWVEQPQRIDLDTLQRTFKAYQCLSEMPRIKVIKHSKLKKDTTHCGFREILGDLLMTDIYQAANKRYYCIPDWQTARSMFHFIKGFADFWQEREKGTSLFVDSLTAYCEKVEREKIQTLIAQTQGDLSSLTHPGEQLFVYYVITRRLMRLSAHDFFAYGYLGERANNFAWLSLPSDQQDNPTYRSLFTRGISFSKTGGDTASTQMIYQKYKDQFRNSYGLREGVPLPPECSNYPNYDQLTSDPLSTLKEWAK